MKKIAIIIAIILILSGCGQSNPAASTQQTIQPASTTATVPTASATTTTIFVNHAPVL